jgi:hypothetical protein
MTFAQEDDEDVVLEEIVTTGSRIRRDEFSSSSPLSVIGGQAILEQGVYRVSRTLVRHCVTRQQSAPAASTSRAFSRVVVLRRSTCVTLARVVYWF